MANSHCLVNGQRGLNYTRQITSFPVCVCVSCIKEYSVAQDTLGDSDTVVIMPLLHCANSYKINETSRRCERKTDGDITTD